MRPRALLTVTAVAVLAGTAATSVSSAAPRAVSAAQARAVAYADWPTYGSGYYRHGTSYTMPAVQGAPRIVKKLALDGQVYASPIVVRGVTILATENNTVYAFDSSYRQLWKHHLGAPSPAAQRPCGNIDPLGITGTPVYEPATGYVYVAPEFSGNPPTHQLYALRFRTGSIAFHRSLDLAGVDRRAMQQRGALTSYATRVYVPFGGLAGDCGSYKGRVVVWAARGTGYPYSYTVPTRREAGIWTPPGLSADSSSLYAAVGNGAALPGSAYDHSDSILKLSPAVRLQDYFAPTSWATENQADLDLGSQGPALVGSSWIFSAGKSGTAYVLRRSRLGHIGGQVSKRSLCTSFGAAAVRGSVVFVPCTDGIRAVRIDSTGHMHLLWHAAGNVIGSPVVGGGRVWSLDPGAGALYALDPTTGATRARIAVGAVSRFATPALYGRDVRVPTLAGMTAVRTS
jgi:outer membrane protein assembly factor BamB